jgi:GNAT superfamily N-acetyltransferase
MNQTDRLSSTPIIRLFQKSDADAVSALVLGIQNDEFNLGLSICDQADLTDIESYYLRSNGTFLVAENDRSDIVGTIGLLRLRADLGVMKKFFVAAPYRGKAHGIAQALYQAFLNFGGNSSDRARHAVGGDPVTRLLPVGWFCSDREE